VRPGGPGLSYAGRPAEDHVYGYITRSASSLYTAGAVEVPAQSRADVAELTWAVAPDFKTTRLVKAKGKASVGHTAAG